jgi:hypothetical protein
MKIQDRLKLGSKKISLKMQLILLQMRDKLAIQQWRSIISADRGVFLIKLEKLVASTFKSKPRITPRAKSQISIRFQFVFFFCSSIRSFQKNLGWVCLLKQRSFLHINIKLGRNLSMFKKTWTEFIQSRPKKKKKTLKTQ